MSTYTYKQGNLHIETRKVSGTLDLSATISGTAVTDATTLGDGLSSQRLMNFTTTDAHGFLADSQIYIEGTTNYDDTHIIDSVTTSGITIRVNKYTAETPGGTETVKFAIAPGCEWVLLEVNLHLSAASATVEDFTATLDAGAGSNYDQVIITKAMNTVVDYSWIGERYFESGDVLRFAHANTNGRTYGLICKYRRIR